MKIQDRAGNAYDMRKLQNSDALALGNYFENLSPETKSRFGPHPLNHKSAYDICHGEKDTAHRFIVLTSSGTIVAYLILEFGMIDHEKQRYMNYGIQLEEGKDLFFAPSVLDAYQNKGLASAVLTELTAYARNAGAMSLVLLGGTQESNLLALGFYTKFGFQPLGGYQTEMFNIDMRLIL
jgi:ribosomal protein S18 acetylase RimI-like enzyme